MSSACDSASGAARCRSSRTATARRRNAPGCSATSASTSQSLADTLNSGGVATLSVPVDLVPVPLSTAVWSGAILQRQVPPAESLRGHSGRRARRAPVSRPRRSRRRHAAVPGGAPAGSPGDVPQAAVFAAFGSHLRIRDGRVVTPGEAQAEAARGIWETLVEASTADPARFVESLFARRSGRLAYLYDTIGELDPPHVAFALGLWIKDPDLRVARARALVGAVAARISGMARAAASVRPSAARLRLASDRGCASTRMEARATPAARRLWERAFEKADLPDDPARQLRDSERSGTIDAAWLAENVAVMDVRVRAQRLMQVAFAYRVLGDAAPDDANDVLVALRAFTRYRSAMLALEQMGVRRPPLYAAAARQAEALGRLTGSRAFVALSQFQGALALVVRLARNGSARGRRRRAARHDARARADAGRRPARGGHGRLGARELLKGEDDAAEHALAVALGGPPRPDAPIVEWEGGRYRLDLAAAESERIQRIRQRQGGYVARCGRAAALDRALAQRVEPRSRGHDARVGSAGPHPAAVAAQRAGEPVRSGARRRRESSRSARHRRAVDPRARADHTAARHASGGGGRGRAPRGGRHRPGGSAELDGVCPGDRATPTARRCLAATWRGGTISASVRGFPRSATWSPGRFPSSTTTRACRGM